MPDRTLEDRVQLAARRCGLRLLKSKQRTNSTGSCAYRLRSWSDATRVVVPQVGGMFALAKIPGFAVGEEAAVWSSLDDVERVLTAWVEGGPGKAARIQRPRGIATAST